MALAKFGNLYILMHVNCNDASGLRSIAPLQSDDKLHRKSTLNLTMNTHLVLLSATDNELINNIIL